jgi:hypothetical protein
MVQGLFIESADKMRRSPEHPDPAIIWYSQGEPRRLQDLHILLKGLIKGQILRVVSDSWSIRPDIESICKAYELHIVQSYEDLPLTRYGCYHHCYLDLQKI